MLSISLALDTIIGILPYGIRRNRVFATASLLVMSFWLGGALAAFSGYTSAVLVMLSIFRAINHFKIIKSSLHPDYLSRVTRRTSLTLAGLTALVLLVSSLLGAMSENAKELVAFTGFLSSVLLLAATSRNLQKTKHHQTRHYYSDKELPTLTVAIPARNETDDLASCLRTVLASDYPKLEVLVYDDCSQDRTSEIIKDFAHDGVRFIAGEQPDERWLAKNLAYQKLLEHASGEMILFCGVDVRFGPSALRSLISNALHKKRDMMSVMPFRIGGGVDTSLIQPLRYWWELALPRRLFNRPPVLSTCWLIRQTKLTSLGGFKSVSHNILPERHFAKEMVKNDRFAFIRADEHLDMRTVKPVEAQLSTAIRTRYPQLQKRPENVFLLLQSEIILLAAPMYFSASLLFDGLTAATVLGTVGSIFLICTHFLIMSASNPAKSFIAIFNLPFALATEMVLTFTSMLKYEFGKVEWKGRNICIPTMHVVSKLPPVK